MLSMAAELWAIVIADWRVSEVSEAVQNRQVWIFLRGAEAETKAIVPTHTLEEDFDILEFKNLTHK